jgi:enoyl-CoA hydratase
VENKYIQTEYFDDGEIAKVILNRPEKRNAQNRGLLVELNDALLEVEADDQVRVVILGALGPMFSSGHDIGSEQSIEEREPGPNQLPSYRTNGGSRKGAEQRMLQEWHYYFENNIRWRNLRKITIAEVYGPVLAAALQLMWACDLVVAADDTTFADVVGARFGMCGLEYFAHPWEFGPRRAKELLLTGDPVDVEEALRNGMVTKVFPRAELSERTLEFARRIARVPTVTSLLIKEAVNQTVDQMGFYNSLQATFSLHQLNHSHWAEVHGGGGGRPMALAEDGVPEWGTSGPVSQS